MVTATPRSIDSPLLGTWRISEMELWEREHLDLVEPAFIRFDEGGSGEFMFIAVHGFINWEATERSGKQAAEFSWTGDDESMPVSGRGWVVLDADKKLSGRIYFHDGDNSGFKATETNAITRKKKPRIATIISKDGIRKIQI